MCSTVNAALDTVCQKQREYEAQVDACPHEWGPASIHGHWLGQECARCKVSELPWLRREHRKMLHVLYACVNLFKDIGVAEDHPIWEEVGKAGFL